MSATRDGYHDPAGAGFKKRSASRPGSARARRRPHSDPKRAQHQQKRNRIPLLRSARPSPTGTSTVEGPSVCWRAFSRDRCSASSQPGFGCSRPSSAVRILPSQLTEGRRHQSGRRSRMCQRAGPRKIDACPFDSYSDVDDMPGFDAGTIDDLCVAARRSAAAGLRSNSCRWKPADSASVEAPGFRIWKHPSGKEAGLSASCTLNLRA